MEVRSAGTAPGEAVNPAAVQAMREVGIDITGQQLAWRRIASCSEAVD